MEQKQLGIAISIAAKAHLGQIDKGGKPYILHPIRLMDRFQDPELKQIAVLHDVCEDTDITLFDLQDLGFSHRVIRALDALTHDSRDSYAEYIDIIAMLEDAILVKLEDLRDNSDITRLKGITPRDLKRMEKYHKAYTKLKEAL